MAVERQPIHVHGTLSKAFVRKAKNVDHSAPCTGISCRFRETANFILIKKRIMLAYTDKNFSVIIDYPQQSICADMSLYFSISHAREMNPVV